MPINTVPALSVSASVSLRQGQNAVSINDTRLSRKERRVQLGLHPGEVFNPFNLFDGAIVPSEILRSPMLLPSEKLVFARLTQFAGLKGKAWPAVERLAQEIALSIPQTRRCVRSLEQHGLIRRLARAGRSNEFEFLWHPLYERQEQESTSRSSVITQPHSPVIAVPQSSMIAPTQSSTIRPPQSPKIAPGRSPVIARRESVESSSEKSQNTKNPASFLAGRKRANDSLRHLIDDDRTGTRQPLEDPEEEFLLRISERHGNAVDRHSVLQCVLGDLRSFSDLTLFLDFEKKVTTAPEKLRNPTGHYRQSVRKFYELQSKRRDWNHREQLRALEAKISSKSNTEIAAKQTCSLGQCCGTGETWDAARIVRACTCVIGQALSPKVIAAFEQINASRAQQEVLVKPEQADAAFDGEERKIAEG